MYIKRTHFFFLNVHNYEYRKLFAFYDFVQ